MQGGQKVAQKSRITAFPERLPRVCTRSSSKFHVISASGFEGGSGTFVCCTSLIEIGRFDTEIGAAEGRQPISTTAKNRITAASRIKVNRSWKWGFCKSRPRGPVHQLSPSNRSFARSIKVRIIIVMRFVISLLIIDSPAMPARKCRSLAFFRRSSTS